MSTPRTLTPEPSARIETDKLGQTDEIEAQLSTGTPPAAVQQQFIEAFLR